MAQQAKPITLIILDGWGYSEAIEHNPTLADNTPYLAELWQNHPHTLLDASGNSVGLPKGQMGNSEVGHLTLGSGRRVPQDLVRISEALEDGSLAKNPDLVKAIDTVKANNKAIHFIGLVSPGGVHSHADHLLGMIDLCAAAGVPQCYVHAFLDGRDVPPQSALPTLQQVSARLHEHKLGEIASLVGRYYAMDRDQRWDRVQLAYDLITEAKAEFHAKDVADGIEQAYARNETDEFVKPTVIGDGHAIEDGDVVMFINFRADRARQLSYVLTEQNFEHFQRAKTPKLAAFLTMTSYASDLNSTVLFPKAELKNTLGEVLSAHHLKQLRIAETEKYAHVTYFFNGGREQPFTDEARELIASPKVATYDLQPEMSANELTDKLVKDIEAGTYDVIICNYANPDMVGHTGMFDAASKAMQTIDHDIKRVVTALQQVGGELLLTADHGNVECMYDEEHQQPHTAHTTNLVPLIYVGRDAHFTQDEGVLADVAPTLLQLLDIKQPEEMSGQQLLELDK